MMIAKFSEIAKFVEERCEEANNNATVIKFSMRAHAKMAALSENASALADLHEFSELRHGYGISAWITALAVDLRKSSTRAVEIGPKQTFITMHTYLPTMIHLVGRAGGHVVGLRGDGLFAAFGITKLVGTGKEVTSEAAGQAVEDATMCGKAMLEAIEDAINPTLEKHGVRGGLEIGAAIDVGKVVITRIGYLSANELTAYGSCIDQACKFNDARQRVVLTCAARDFYPTADGGTMRFKLFGSKFFADFPDDMYQLHRESHQRRKPR